MYHPKQDVLYQIFIVTPLQDDTRNTRWVKVFDRMIYLDEIDCTRAEFDAIDIISKIKLADINKHKQALFDKLLKIDNTQRVDNGEIALITSENLKQHSIR